MARGVVGVRTGLRDARTGRHCPEARPRVHRHAAFAHVHARGAVPGWRADARPGQRERRFPAAPDRLLHRRQPRWRALAGPRHRRGRFLRHAADHRFVPPQGPSAAVGTGSSCRQKWHGRPFAQRRGRGLADAGGGSAGAGAAPLARSPDRGAGGLCTPGGPIGAAAVWRSCALRGCQGTGRGVGRRREAGHLAGQCRRPASAARCHPAGGAGHRPAYRRTLRCHR